MAEIFDSFAVTGAPRSGTMALARFLDTSPTWTVKHQSDTREIALAHQHPSLMSRFRRNYYGEVSCALLLTFQVLPAKKKLVILRDPRDCILSAWNYYHAVKGADFALGDEAEMTFRIVDLLAERYDHIPYNDLFGIGSSPKKTAWLFSAASYLGVDDLPDNLNTDIRFNSYPRKTESWGDLPKSVRAKAKRETDWFREKWASALFGI